MTEQEAFWAGDFGTEYTTRNSECDDWFPPVAMFGRMLQRAPGIYSAMEFGCNVGRNLNALSALIPNIELVGVEINEFAAKRAALSTGAAIVAGSVLDVDWDPADLVFTMGLLIHTAPDELPQVYDQMWNHSKRYLLTIEYYSPRIEMIPYHGEDNRLWKRDFAGELMDRYPLRLVDYGFIYRRDAFPQDDVTWFLMEKEGK